MFGRVRTIGMAVAGVGVAVLLAFGGVAVQTVTADDFRQARQGRAREPGNAMYDLQLFIVTTRLGFLIAAAAGGGLLALNGATLVLLGHLAERAAGGERS